MRQDFNYPARVWRPRTALTIVILATSFCSGCVVLSGIYAKLSSSSGEFSFMTDGLNVLLPLLGMGAFSYLSLLQFAMFPDIEIRPEGFRLRAGIFRSQLIPWDQVARVKDVPLLGSGYPLFSVAGKGFGFPFSGFLLPFMTRGRGFLVSKEIGDIGSLRAIFDEHVLP